MEFNYTEEQLALQDTLQRFISRDYDFDKRKRDPQVGTWAIPPKPGSSMQSSVCCRLPFPEDLGGLGGKRRRCHVGDGAIWVRVCCMEPYLSTVVISGGLLRDAASKALQAETAAADLLRASCQTGAGGLRGAGRYDLSLCGLRGDSRSGGNWRLSGRKTVVLDGASADYFLVSARSSGKTGDRDGMSLFLVPRDAKGLDGRRLSHADQARARQILSWRMSPWAPMR